MPAKRKRRFKISNRRTYKKIVIFLFFILFFGLIVFLNSLNSFFKDDPKLAISVYKNSGEVDLFVLDKTNKEITKIVIPGDTLVDAANRYGYFRLANIKRLSDTKGEKGILLVGTIVKNFKFPVYVWTSEEQEFLFEKNLIEAFNSFVRPGSSNLKFGDKFAILIFSLLVPENKRLNINLDETGYLKEEKLPDGNLGFLITLSEPPTKIASVFADENFYNKNQKVAIISDPDLYLDVKYVVKVIEVIGSKVVVVRNSKVEDTNCRVIGLDRLAVVKLARVFGCVYNLGEGEEGVDITLTLGRNFDSLF